MSTNSEVRDPFDICVDVTAQAAKVAKNNQPAPVQSNGMAEIIEHVNAPPPTMKASKSDKIIIDDSPRSMSKDNSSMNDIMNSLKKIPAYEEIRGNNKPVISENVAGLPTAASIDHGSVMDAQDAAMQSADRLPHDATLELSDDPNDMRNILHNLKTISKKVSVSESIFEDAQKDVNLEIALTQEITENTVSVENYRIEIRTEEFANLDKNFYDIIDIDRNEIIYEELGLFETAMGVVKNLMLEKYDVVDDLVDYDDIYLNNLYEVYTHKDKIKREVNEDINYAKFTKAKDKVTEIKRKILEKL